MIVRSVKSEKFDLFVFKISFSSWIREKFKSRCNSADNLFEETDLVDEMNESDENDERNCWKNESKSKNENERNDEIWCCFSSNVVNKMSEIIFFFIDWISINLSLNLFSMSSKFARLESIAFDMTQSWVSWLLANEIWHCLRKLTRENSN
jgi:hypothetical protein